MKNKFILIAIVLIIIIFTVFIFSFFNKDSDEQKKSDLFSSSRYSIEVNGLDLIENDFKAGEIDLETALIYKVKFIFGDSSFPDKYFVNNNLFEDMGVFVDVQENWENLSEETKSSLEPYFLRPDNPESFISKAVNQEIKISEKNNFEIIKSVNAADRPVSYKSDDSLVTADKNIKVWYLEKKEFVDDKEKITKLYYDVAKKIVNNLNTDKAYSEYVELLGKKPPSDGTLGEDSKTDIYIVPNNSPLFGGFGFSVGGLNVPDNGKGKSSFILVNNNLNDVELRTTTVHELFHAFQRAFKCSFAKNNIWWIEGTATWSEDLIYPEDNTEQGYVKRFIPKPEKSLFENGELFEYGAYLFPFYLSNKYDKTVITNIFNGCETTNGDPVKSADNNIEEGFKKNWKEFTLWNYNQKPVEYYKNADKSKKFTEHTSESGKDFETTFISFVGEENYSFKSINPLSTYLMSFLIADEEEEIRKVSFENLKNFGDQSEKGGIKAIVYPKKSSAYIEDWTRESRRSFCFDMPKEDIDKIILIFSNGDIKNKINESSIKVKATESCYEINQGEKMMINPIFGLTPNFSGTLDYEAKGVLEKDSVPDNAKYPYMGKWKVEVSYLETFPSQSLGGITVEGMEWTYDHVLEFDLSKVEDDSFEINLLGGDFHTGDMDIYNEISGLTNVVPETTVSWDISQKGLISEMSEEGCKINLPEFVLYNSGGYRDLPYPITLEIKK